METKQSRRVEIIAKQQVFKKFIFRIDEVQLRHERFDGTMSETLTRLNLDRGDSVAALLHNPDDDTLVLAEQFRYPTYDKGPGWLLEIVAGMIDDNESPADAMRREIDEEIGYTVQALHHINTCYLSPGGTSERIHLFYASVTPQDKTKPGGGLLREGENIRSVILSVDDVMAKVANHAIPDAKTLIALQWLALHRNNLPTE